MQLTDVMTPHGVEIPAHLEAQAEVPLLAGLQRQGDVIVNPTRPGKVAGLEPVAPEGVAVVRGESGGNTHLLVGDGDVRWARRTDDPQTMGVLVVGRGASAYLVHPEHGAAGIAPGCYIVSRQRTQQEEVRILAD